MKSTRCFLRIENEWAGRHGMKTVELVSRYQILKGTNRDREHFHFKADHKQE